MCKQLWRLQGNGFAREGERFASEEGPAVVCLYSKVKSRDPAGIASWSGVEKRRENCALEPKKRGKNIKRKGLPGPDFHPQLEPDFSNLHLSI